MSFAENVSAMHDLFRCGGFGTMCKPYPLDQVREKKNVIDCICIASRNDYEVIYAEVKSNQESIAGDLIRSHLIPCLVITRMGQTFVYSVMNDEFGSFHVRISEDRKNMLKTMLYDIGKKIGNDKWMTNKEVIRYLHTIKNFQ